MQYLAKLTRPKLSGVYPRTRLFKSLDRCRAAPIVWVCGPPGAGKTTLISSYIARRKHHAIWYQIDAGDADPATFFRYLREAAPNVKTALPLLTPEYLPDPSGFTRRFFRELFRHLPRPSALVLDNLHEARSDQLHGIVRDAAAETPTGANLFVISRDQPPVEFARLRINETFAMLGWRALRFTLEETAAVARLRGLTGETVARQLHERSGGWAAGLTALIGPIGEGDTAPAAATPQALLDYFAREVFDRAPARMRELWLRTAYLPRFTVKMARALTEDKSTGALLEELCDGHYFIDRRAASQRYYQYHALFREFLAHQVKRSFSPAQRRKLAHSSARLLEDQGDHETALALYRQAAAIRTTLRLILEQAPSLLAQGRWRTLARWIGILPHTTVNSEPWLLYWSGVCEGQSSPAAGRAILEAAYARFVEAQDAIGQGLSAAGVIESYFVDWSDFSVIDPWVEVLEKVLGQRPTFPSPESELRVWCNLLIALTYRKPGYAFAAGCAERVWQLCRADGVTGPRLMAAAALLQYILATADLGKAAAVIAEFGRLADCAGTTPLQRLAWAWQRWMYLMNAGDTQRAEQAIEQTLELATRHGLVFAATMNRSFQVWGLLASNHLGAASNILDSSAGEFRQGRRNDVAIYYFLRSWEALLQERPRTAVWHAEKAARLAEQLGHAGPAICTSCAYAQALAVCGELERALTIIRGAKRWVSTLQAGILRFSVSLFEADVLRRLNRREAFLRTLSEACATGRRSEQFNCLLWLPRMLARLCAEALGAGIETEYVERLIKKRNLLPESPYVEHWPWSVKIYTLGRFSLVVDDEPVAFARKAPKKPITLLKAIIALGGRDVPQSRVMDALWPDEAGDAAQRAFGVALHRLRKILAHGDALPLREGRLSLDPGMCWVDAWAFERLAAQAEPAHGGRLNGHIRVIDDALALYNGNFLNSDPEEHWTLSARERLRASYIRLVSLRAAHLQQIGAPEQAIDCYRKGLAADELAESFYQGIMRCYRDLERPAEGLVAYQRLSRMLSVKLGVSPSPGSQALARKLRDI